MVNSAGDLVDGEKIYLHNPVAFDPLSPAKISEDASSFVEYKLEPSSGSNVQRVENYMLTSFAVSKFLRFQWQFKFPEGTIPPTNWVVLHQIRQDGDSGSPTVALEMVPNSVPLKLKLLVRNKNFYFNNGSNGPLGNAVELATISPSIGDWHQISLEIKGGSNGFISFKFGGQEIKKFFGEVGFPRDFLGKTIFETATAHLGIYQGPQSGGRSFWVDDYEIDEILNP